MSEVVFGRLAFFGGLALGPCLPPRALRAPVGSLRSRALVDQAGSLRMSAEAARPRRRASRRVIVELDGRVDATRRRLSCTPRAAASFERGDERAPSSDSLLALISRTVLENPPGSCPHAPLVDRFGAPARKNVRRTGSRLLAPVFRGRPCHASGSPADRTLTRSAPAPRSVRTPPAGRERPRILPARRSGRPSPRWRRTSNACIRAR